MPNESFISYSRKDFIFVDKLYERLKALGIDPWLDKHDIPSASLWKQEILVAIQFCHNFIYVISPHSIESKYCDMELNQALALNKRLIPIVAKSCNYDLVRSSVTELNYIFFDTDFEDGFEKLVKLLDSPIGTSHGERLDSQIVIFDNVTSRTFPLYRDKYLVGRNPISDFSKAGLIFSKDSRVSRHHATLIRKEQSWWIRDEDSSNGIFIKRENRNTRMLDIKRLKALLDFLLIDGDVITLSPYTSFIYQEIECKEELPLTSLELNDLTFTGEEE